MADLHNDDSSNDSDDETVDFYKPSFVLIGIDTHPSMFVKNEEGGTHFQNCLQACHYISDCLVMAKDPRSFCQFAVILATDEGTPLVKFSDNIIDSTKALKKLVDSPFESLSKTYRRNTKFDLAYFFSTAKKLFNDVKTPYSKRTFVYVTTDDNPVNLNSHKRFTALNEAQNFKLAEITFQLVSLVQSFDYSIFYNELYSVCDSPLVEEVCEDLEGLLEKLSNLIIQKIKKLKVKFYPFRGHLDKFIDCYRVSYITESKMLCNAKISPEGEVVQRVSTQVANKEYQFGKGLTVSEEERANLLKNDVPMGLTLYMVSPKLSQPGVTVHSPFLLIVGEQATPNNYFNEFWQFCLNKDRVLICLYKPQKTSRIRFVELTPKLVNKTNMFLVKILPFNNEVNNIKTLKCDEEITDNDKTLMKEVIKRLEFDYDPSFFPNIKYSKMKAHVKAKLLDQEVEDVIDFSVSEEALEERLGDLVEALKLNFDWEEEGKKRKLTTAAKRPTKKTKT